MRTMVKVGTQSHVSYGSLAQIITNVILVIQIIACQLLATAKECKILDHKLLSLNG